MSTTTTTSTTITPLLTQQATLLNPSLVKITLPVDTTLGTQEGATNPSGTISETATTTSSEQTVTDTVTDTVTSTQTGTCSPRDPLCNQGSISTTGTSQQADLTTADPGSRDTSASRPDLSNLVDLETLNVSTQQTEQQGGTECIATTESAAGTSSGICITPGQAVDYATPGIVNNQAQITIVVIIATLTGLALTILISYILNSAASRREQKRIQRQQADGPKQFAQKQASASYQNVTEQIANIISKTSNAPTAVSGQTTALSGDDIRNLQKALGSLELFGSPQTAKSAQELLKLLYRHNAATTASSPKSKAAESTTSDTIAQINQAANRLAENLKGDLSN
ncbi:hypothetical protein KBB06_04855 [Candidatus Gracilibacteria bacterium]|nr:hypothetical protein [Candidatus Gracilibacteria bacterium]